MWNAYAEARGRLAEGFAEAHAKHAGRGSSRKVGGRFAEAGFIPCFMFHTLVAVGWGSGLEIHSAWQVGPVDLDIDLVFPYQFGL